MARGLSLPIVEADAPEYDLDDLPSDLEIAPEYREAFAIRRDNFDNSVGFFAPSVKHYETDELSNCSTCSFIGISVTGPGCALQCDHCQAQVLKAMTPATTSERLWEIACQQHARGSQGLLISGGSTKNNTVPMMGHFETMRRIKHELGMKLLVHVAFATDEIAKGLASIPVDSVMLDIIGSEDTISDVYHLPWASTENYRRTLACLSEHGLPLSPHIVIGLHRGEIRGEYRALEMIAEVPIKSLVLVILQPILGTPMAKVTPPSPAEIGKLFVAARKAFPTTDILLGCERPHGEHKRQTDALAIKAGINGIAYPAEGIIALSQALGLSTSSSSMCCSLKFQGT